MSPVSKQPCVHQALTYDASPHAKAAKYKPFTTQQLYTAGTGSRKHVTPEANHLIDTFPAPLVLPEDDLAVDSSYPPQRLLTWRDEVPWNRISSQKNVVYVAVVPTISKAVKFMEAWLKPAKELNPLQPPSFKEILAYLKAFYHGVEVKRLPTTLNFRAWISEEADALTTKQIVPTLPKYVGLESNGSVTRIRVRHLGNKINGITTSPYSSYGHQLNLNDILDHAIANLPADAASLILLMDHDIYEDEEDDFCCGRAYGGSRVAVVSSAQYNPCLDQIHGIGDLRHTWPGSHCRAYVELMGKDAKAELSEKNVEKKDTGNKTMSERRKRTFSQATESKAPMSLPSRRKIQAEATNIGLSSSDPIIRDSSPVQARSLQGRSSSPLETPPSPLTAAIRIHNESIPLTEVTKAFLSSVYALRVARTASHELGHCFGFDHCVFLACAMQGTCSGAEDARQPPYLCYVCEQKLGFAITTSPGWKKTMEGVESKKRGENSARQLTDGSSKSTEPAGLDILSMNSTINKWKIDRHRAMIDFCKGTADQYREAFKPFGAWSQRMLDILEIQ